MAKPARVVAATPAVWRRPSLSEGLSAMQAAGGGANTLRREFPANVLTGTRLFLLVEVISHMGRTGWVQLSSMRKIRNPRLWNSFPKIRFCHLGYATCLADALRGDAGAAHRRRLYRRARLSSAAVIRHQSFSLRFAFSDGLRKNDQRIANVPVTIRLLPLFAPRFFDGPHRSGIVSRRSISEREPCSK